MKIKFKRTNLYLRCCFALLAMTLTSFLAIGQNSENFPETPGCHTLVDAVKETLPEAQEGNCYPDTYGPIYMKVYVHAVRRDDCGGGQTIGTIRSAMDRLISQFAPLDIHLIWDECEMEEHCITSTYNFGTLGLALACTPGGTPCLRQFNHDDGIDIYFGGTDITFSGFSGGLSQGSIPSANGRAVIVAGSFWEPPFMPIVETDVLTHEMGHAFGLFHTFQEWDDCPDGEFVDGSNCEDCGDLVCDTPADVFAGQMFSIDPDECIFDTGGLTDINGDPYDPDEHNFMSYAHASCINNFSACQVERMRYMIATSGSGGPNGGFLNARRYNFDHDDLAVTQDEIWDSSTVGDEVTISNTLTVESGATLTIQASTTVKFNKGAKLIIKPDATLLLSGTLTSFCNSVWKGVEVWGDNSQSQYTLGGVNGQGRLVCRAGSLIENAEVAAQLWGPNFFTNSGGILSTYRATFKNNRIGVQFGPYQNTYPYPFPPSQTGQPVSYFGTLNECSFETDADYPSSAEPFHSFVHMTGVNGVRVYGSSFSNTQTPAEADDIADYGYGIYASDSGFNVYAKCTSNTFPCNNYLHSSFEGLGYGIYTTNVTGNKPYYVRQSDFTNCYIGLYNNAVSLSTMLFNDFNLGNVPDPSLMSDQIGVMLENNISGFTFEQNDFTGTQGNAGTTIGTISINTGTFNKKIRKNNYTDLNYGNLANGDNATHSFFDRGLHYLCNDNTDISEYDFAVPDGKIRHSQGVEVQVVPGVVEYDASGNEFSYTGVDFLNDGSNPVNYYYFPMGTNETPMIYSGSFTPQQTNENTCPNTYCEPPCKTKFEVAVLKDDYYSHRSLKEYSKSAYESATAAGDLQGAAQYRKEADYHQRTMDDNAFLIGLHLALDTTTHDEDSLLLWLGNLDNFGADLNLALHYQSKGNASTATSFVQQAGQRDDLNNQQMSDLLNITYLMDALEGQSPYDLSEEKLGPIKELASIDDGYSANIAQNIMTWYGAQYPPEYRLPEGGGKGSEKSDDSTDDLSSGKVTSIFPNPSEGIFSILWQPTSTQEQQARLVINDISGKAIASYVVNAFERTQITLSPEHKGIYFYQLTSNDQIVEVGKLVVQ